MALEGQRRKQNALCILKQNLVFMYSMYVMYNLMYRFSLVTFLLQIQTIIYILYILDCLHISYKNTMKVKKK